MKLPLSPRADRLDIWRVPLPLPPEVVGRYELHLSPDERKKSGDYHFARDRQNYVSSRGALRVVLSSYLGERPAALTFEYGLNGKPFLAHLSRTRRIEFNLSHCRSLAIIAVAQERPVGVDVEAIRDIPQLDEISEQYFTREERSLISSVVEEHRVRLFLHFWTRREALAKARGLGVAAALADVEIPPYPPGSQSLLKMPRNGDWFLRDLQLGPGHVGAACSKGGDFDVRYHDFNPQPNQLGNGVEDWKPC